MIGLEFLCIINDLSVEDLSKKLNVKNEKVIQEWFLGNGEISKEDCEILQEIFHVPSAYFNRELDREDKTDLFNITKQIWLQDKICGIEFKNMSIKYLRELKEKRILNIQDINGTIFKIPKDGHENEVQSINTVLALLQDDIKVERNCFYTIMKGNLFIPSNIMKESTDNIVDAIKFKDLKEAIKFHKKLRNDANFKIIAVSYVLNDCIE